jgi:hypothetical protein
MIILTFFHKALFFPSLLTFSILVYFFFNNDEIKLNFKLLFLVIFISLLSALILNYTKFGYHQFVYGIPKAVDIYQNGLLIESKVRANFREYPVNIANFYDLLIFSLSAIRDYFFAPYLNQIQKPADLLAQIENYTRIVLILILIINIISSVKKNKISIIVLIIYLAVEFVWAMGTSNWGTAMRHHTIANGILLLSLGLTFAKKIND